MGRTADASSANMADQDSLNAELRKATSGVARLIKAKADVNSQDEDGLSCLHIAAEKGLDKTIKMLLKAGADPSIEDAVGTTAIKVATENGNDKIAAMMEAGAAALPPGGTPNLAGEAGGVVSPVMGATEAKGEVPPM